MVTIMMWSMSQGSSKQLPAEFPESWELGKKNVGLAPEGEAQQCGPTAGNSSHLTTCRDPMGINHDIPTFLCKQKWWRVLSARVQENKLDQWDNRCRGYRTQLPRGPSWLERTARKKIWKIKEMRPKVSSHLSVSIPQLNLPTQSHRKPRITRWQRDKSSWSHQLKIHLLQRLSRARLSKCQLTFSTIIRFSHPTRRNEDVIPAARNEQKVAAGNLKCLLFAIRPDNWNYLHYVCSMGFLLFWPKDISF